MVVSDEVSHSVLTMTPGSGTFALVEVSTFFWVKCEELPPWLVGEYLPELVEGKNDRNPPKIKVEH